MTPVNLLRLGFLGLVTLVIGVPGIVLALVLPGRRLKARLFHVVSKSYARVVLGVFGVRVAASGLGNVDPARPYVFMSNHLSHVDAPALALVIPQPLHWVFKKELARIPVFGWVLLACGQIMVDRSDPERSRATLSRALAGLSGNSSVMIYPEGTRSRDGALQPFKKGGFWMALHAGLPIVPVRVSGTREIVPAGTLDVTPGTARIAICPPVETRGRTPDDIPDLMVRVREAMTSGTTGPG